MNLQRDISKSGFYCFLDFTGFLCFTGLALALKVSGTVTFQKYFFKFPIPASL